MLLLRSIVPVFIVVAALFIHTEPAAAAADPKPVRVVYCKDCAPFSFTNEMNQPDGMVIAKWKLWSRKTGRPVDFVAAVWNDTIDYVTAGKADIHGGLFYNASRDTVLDFAGPILKSDTHIFFDKSLPPPDDIKEFKAYRIGVLKGDFSMSWFQTHLPEFSLAPFDSFEDMMAALKTRELMVFAADTPTGLYHLAHNDLHSQFSFRSDAPIYSNDLRPAVKQGNSRLLKAIQEGMDKISEEESRQILREWASGNRQEDDGALVIAMARDYPPLTMVDPDGTPTGLLVDMWRLWSEASGLKIRFRASTWAQSVEAVRNGSADIHSGLFKDAQRETWMKFSNPIHRAKTTLYFNTGAAIASLNDLAGQPVGVVQGSLQENWLNSNYPDIRTVPCIDTEQLVLTLLKKNVRAVFYETMAVEAVISRLGLAGKIKKYADDILSNAIYVGVPQFNDTLIPLINEGFSAIAREELSALEQQWIPRKENRFYSEDTSNLVLTRAEREFVANHLPLTFSEVDWPPLSITDKQAKFRGMIADYLDIVTRKTGLHFTFTPSDAWSQVLENYRTGAIDMIPAIGDKDDVGRPIALSRDYVKFPLVIVTRDNVSYIASTDQLNGRRVAVGRGYTSYHYLKNNFPDIQLIQTDDVNSGLRTLANGQVDAFVGHMAVVIHTIQEKGLTNLKIAGETGYVFNHRIGINPKYSIAVSIINKALDSLTEEDHRAIYQKWLSVHYEKGIDVWLIVKILAGALALIAVVFYWNRRLASEVAERKKTEHQLLENERKTRAMSEAIHDGLVMVDGAARVMYWNHAAENMFGMSADEVIGKDMHAILAPEEYRKTATKGLKGFIQTGEGPVVGRLQELVAQKKDGTKFPVEVGVSAFQIKERWYAVGTIRDITERIKVQETVNQIRTELQQIFDNAHVGILFVKPQTRIYRCNMRMAQILGYDSPKQMVEINMADIHLSPKSFQAFEELYHRPMGSGEQVRTEYQLRRKDGAGIWCAMSGRALDPSGQPDLDQGLIWVIDDITEKRVARQALKESENRVRTILDSINTGVLIIDPEKGTVVDANPATARMMKVPMEKIVGKKCHEVVVCQGEETDCPDIDKHRRIDNSEQIPAHPG